LNPVCITVSFCRVHFSTIHMSSREPFSMFSHFHPSTSLDMQDLWKVMWLLTLYLLFSLKSITYLYKAVHVIISVNASVDSVVHTIFRHLLVLPIIYKHSNTKIWYLESKMFALLNIPLSFSLIHIIGIHLDDCFQII
jgi:hypothetical protein